MPVSFCFFAFFSSTNYCRKTGVYRWVLVNNAFGQLEIAIFLSISNGDFSIDQKIPFWPMHIDFYQTNSKRTCLHLQNALYFE